MMVKKGEKCIDFSYRRKWVGDYGGVDSDCLRVSMQGKPSDGGD